MKPISAVFASVGVIIVIILGAFVSSRANTNSSFAQNAAPSASAAAPFQLAKKTDRKLTASDIKKVETTVTKGKLSAVNGTLTFTQKVISLVATTGPEDDMLSFRIQGIRNPTLVIPSGATLKVLFVNTDGGMVHDFLIGKMLRPIANHPTTANTVGTDRMQPAENNVFSAQQLTISAGADGVFSYFCSVGGHAKKGMWGTIAVGKNAAMQKLSSGHDAGDPHNHDMHM